MVADLFEDDYGAISELTRPVEVQNRQPNVFATVDPATLFLNQPVKLNVTSSVVPDGSIETIEWEVDGRLEWRHLELGFAVSLRDYLGTVAAETGLVYDILYGLILSLSRSRISLHVR